MYIVEYNNVKSMPNKRQCTMNTRNKNPRINRQKRQKITFHGSTCPKEISQQCTPAAHTEAVNCQGSWGLPSLTLTTKGSWILWGVSPSLSSAI